MNAELLAKSASRPFMGKQPTVEEHCREVASTATSILDVIGKDLMAAMGVDAVVIEQLRLLLLAAAILHDIGKVNSAFQAMLRAKPGNAGHQPVRHEILAAWLLSDPDFLGRWFAKLRQGEEIWPVIWTVAGHHLRMRDPARGGALFNFASGTKTLSIPLTSVRELLQHVNEEFNPSVILPQFGDCCFETADDDDEGLEQRIISFTERSCRAWSQLRRNSEVVHRTALLKALLIAADVASSAVAASKELPPVWVRKALSARILPETLRPVIEKGTKGKEPFPFQKEVSKSRDPATIVIAGCGNGKTTAAYLWAQQHAHGRKLWFTYPTTGTASAGYEGYLFDHPDLCPALIHGRAEADLQAMLRNREDDGDEESLRLKSLRAWGQNAFACTVDTVLGLLQNQLQSLLAFPAIVAGAFVFDEIHNYDSRLFGSLLRFLRMFPGVPVLLMSASIPLNRLAALREVLGDRVGDLIRGDPAMESYRRYKIEQRDSAESCRQEVTDALRGKKKVLWVCNTISDAVTIARAAHEWAGVVPEKIIVYHSRFRYRDRVERQTKVIEEFRYDVQAPDSKARRNPGACLVVSTQVCEMSLDISADLMVTPECPLPSLVQRLGRLNRFATADDPWKCLVYPFQGDPYNERPEHIQTRGDFRVGMAAARKATCELAGRPCSQRDLAERLDCMGENERFETYSAWLDDGWLTEPCQLRAGGDSITLVREEDLEEIKRELGRESARPSKWTSQSLVPWTIPMRWRGDFRPERRVGGYPVAAADTVIYTIRDGAAWQTRIT